MTDPFEALDEQEFLTMFEQCRFPLRQWRHRPHVTVAYLYLCQYPLEQAIDKLRQGIKAHNAANGLAAAYHETLTIFWARAIHAVISAHGPSDSARNFFDRHSYLLNKMLPLLFYSHGRIMSKQARHEFVEPDLLGLPIAVDSSTTEVRYEPDLGYLPIQSDPVVVVAQTTQTIERNPDYAEAYFHRGQSYFQLKNFDQATADFTKTLELNRDHDSAYYALGAIQAIQNNAEAALTHLQKALTLGHYYPHRIDRDPSWDNIRDNPAFQTLITTHTRG